MDFDLIPGVTAEGELPDVVRERLAANLADESTPEGEALARVIGPGVVVNPTNEGAHPDGTIFVWTA